MSDGTRFLYAARPIDQAGTDSRASRWAKKAYERAEVAGLGVFRPERAFQVPVGAKPSRYIERVNRQALANSSGVIALLPSGIPTIGVPMEIEHAWANGIPVAVVTDGPVWSLIDRGGIAVFDPDDTEAAVEWLALHDYTREDRRRALPFAPVGHGEARLPTRAHEDDAGLDLYVSERTCVPVDQFRDVPCSVGVEMQPYHWGLIVGRSSTLRKRGLIVNPGIIDPGYRGELYAGVFNMGNEAVYLEKGERVAQFILLNNATQSVVPRMVGQLAPSARGTNGSGSSGA